ncbi:hypothetical protein NQ318_022507 [Aromia moschata]|uniref:Inorganic phosphate cotransporter n=1 Tax=Aromia moschata TaxID=1265417 RepID=A0AAV8Z7U3_9CUCU|nr:hypothetical protein NQ318_022507 [Aromia moschata]
MPFRPLHCQYGKFIIHQRYILVIMMQLALLNAYHLRSVINIAITEMSRHKNDSRKVDSCPEFHYEPVAVKGETFEWSDNKESLILSAFYIGYVFGNIPGGWLADKLGARHVMGCSMVLSAILNAFTPSPSTNSGPLYPSISAFLQCWIPRHERGFLGGVAFGGANLGTLVGSVCTVWYVFYLFMVFSKPKTHPFISDKEHDYLKEELEEHKKVFKVPWLKIICSPAVWALLAGQWAHNFIYFTLFTTLPKYMKEILKLNVKSNAFFSSVPFFTLWIFAIFFAWLADEVTNRDWLSLAVARKLYTFVGGLIPAICILMTVYVRCNRAAAIAFYTIGVTLLAPFFSGMKINVNDITRHYAGTIMAVVNGLGATAAILGTTMVGQIVTEVNGSVLADRRVDAKDLRRSTTYCVQRRLYNSAS